MRSRPRFVGSLPCLLLLVAAAAGAKDRPKAPGTYKDWGDLDQLEIVKTFRLADYHRIAIAPIDAKSVSLPEKDDNAYEAAQKTVAGATATFGQALREAVEDFSRIPVEVQDEGVAAGSAPAPSTLIVRGRIVTLDPGSKAARITVGLGAGAARTGIEGQVVDGASGEVLLRFSQERRSGSGLMGGGYQKLMEKNIRKIAEDLAKALKEF